MKNKKLNKIAFLILFYLCSFTWALPTTIIGGLAGIVMMIATKKFYRFGPCICLPLGDNWGFEMGLFFIGTKDKDYDLSCHEFGHQLQACILGPFTFFIATLPSIIRFWIREFQTEKQKRVFTWSIYGMLLAAGGIVMGFGAMYNVAWLSIVGASLLVYCSLLNVWMQEEVPKVDTDYDDFWVEGMATDFGTKAMKKFYE